MVQWWTKIVERSKQSELCRTISFRLQGVGAEIFFPFRALRIGHLFLVVYTLGLSALVIWCAAALSDEITAAFKSAAQQAAITEANQGRIILILQAFLCFLALPFLLTAIALPHRILWIRGTLKTIELPSRTFSSAKESLRAMTIGMRAEIYHLVPLIVLVLGYIAFSRQLQNRTTAQIYLLAVFIVFITTVWKSLPVFAAPLVAIVGHFNGRDATYYAGQVVRSRAMEFLVITLLLVATYLGIWIQFHGHSIIVAQISGFELSLYALSTWYGISLLSYKILQVLAAFSEQPAPQQPRPQQTQAAPPPVINIENLWVSQGEKGYTIKNPPS
jgi:hypothetical protein